jgi:hypothetical protein
MYEFFRVPEIIFGGNSQLFPQVCVFASLETARRSLFSDADFRATNLPSTQSAFGMFYLLFLKIHIHTHHQNCERK